MKVAVALERLPKERRRFGYLVSVDVRQEVGPVAESVETIACGLTVRPREHTVLVRGRAVRMTPREFEILARLASHPGWVLSAEQLSDESDEAGYSPESVSVHVSRLRHKLGQAGAPDAIETIRGFGYRLRASTEGDGILPPDAAPAVGRALRDATWQLTEAVLEVEHSGSTAQQGAACEALDRARRAIYASLAE